VPSLELKPGFRSTLVRTFTQEDFDRFATLSGDDNPIHVNPEFSAHTRFGRTVAHGMLLYSVMSALIQRSFEGFALPLFQELIFRVPTFTGEEVRFEIEIEAVKHEVTSKLVIDDDQAPETLVCLKQAVLRPDGELGLEGSAVFRILPASFKSGAQNLYRSPDQETRSTQDKYPLSIHKGLYLTESATLSRTFTSADLEEYTSITGDPVMTIPDGKQAALPAALTGGLFSYLLGAVLPGPGTNWLKQKMRYLAPAFPGDDLTASVHISRLRPEKDLVNLITVCRAGSKIICEGEALVLVKDLVEK
jgi:acyl dehydratase